MSPEMYCVLLEVRVTYVTNVTIYVIDLILFLEVSVTNVTLSATRIGQYY